jgi:Cdc6-like AAA superfamily ATPase
MKLPEPHHVYSVLWHSICKTCVGSKSRSSKAVVSSSAAAGALENFFRPANPHSLKNRPIVILVLDEIDYLLTSKQSVLVSQIHFFIFVLNSVYFNFFFLLFLVFF